jgi:hypothetical protein
MKTFLYFSLFISTILLSACSVSVDEKPPKIISDGFEAYRSKGADSAIALWTSTWFKGDSGSVKLLTNGLIENEKNCGKFSGYELVKTISVGKNYQLCYITMFYPIRPYFACIILYKNPSGQWVVMHIGWNADINEVFPREIYVK